MDYPSRSSKKARIVESLNLPGGRWFPNESANSQEFVGGAEGGGNPGGVWVSEGWGGLRCLVD